MVKRKYRKKESKAKMESVDFSVHAISLLITFMLFSSMLLGLSLFVMVLFTLTASALILIGEMLVDKFIWKKKW